MIISIQEALAYARKAGFSGENLITIVALAMAESGLDTEVVNSIGATGILQIYLKVHPDVSSAQAKDPAFSFRYAWKLSNGGKNFCPWQAYDSSICGQDWDNRYKPYMPVVRSVINGTTYGNKTMGTPPTVVVQQIAGNLSKGAKTAIMLSSNDSVATFLGDLDRRCDISNPFDVDTASIQSSIVGVSFTDPVKWASQVGVNIISDSVALMLRAIFIILGVYLLFRVVDHYLNITGAIQQGVETVSKVGMMI